MLESLLLMGLSCCACIVAPSLYLLSLGFFFCNFFQRGFFNSSLILFFELSSENLQKIGPPLLMVRMHIHSLQVFWGIGEMLIPLLALNWRVTMLFYIGAPMVASAALTHFAYDSPRFLVVKKQFDRAHMIIEDVARTNHRVLPAAWVFEDEVRINQLKEKMAQLIHDDQIESEARRYNYR